MGQFPYPMQSKRLTARVSEAGRSIFFVMLLINVLHDLQRDVDGLVDHSEHERQQRQNFQQSHRASPLAFRHREDSLFKKSPFPRYTGSFRGMVWYLGTGA